MCPRLAAAGRSASGLLILLFGRSCGHVDPPPAVSRVRHHAIATRLDPSVSLTASELVLEGDTPTFVSASWERLPPRASDAWVGLYLAHEDVTQVVPLKYSFCNRSSTESVSNTSGRLTFRILNFRENLVFRLFHGWDRPQLVAQSPVITVRKPSFPTGVHLSLTGVAGEIALTWTSTAAQASAPGVNYSIFDAGGRMISHGVAGALARSQYSRGELCGAPASQEGFRDPGVFYTAKLQGLLPGWTVRYRVGAEGSWSNHFSFRAPPARASRVKIFAFGDMGEHPSDDSAQGQGEPWYSQLFAYGDPGALNTTLAMRADHLAEPADLVLHNGDLSYAMGYSSMWEVYHDNIQALSASVPWMVTMGNHERDWPGSNSTGFGGIDSMGECGVPTMRRFAAHPFVSARLPPHDQPWYTFSIGAVAVVATSTEHDLRPGSAQHAWLAKTLEAIDREATPWLVLAGHRPFVVDSSWPADQDFAAYFQAAVGPLIELHKVDLILGGHHHSYQRSCALRGGRCSNGGVVVLNVGMAGAGLNPVNKTMPPLFRHADDQHYGFCRIVADAETLRADYIHSDDRMLYDSVTLRKEPSQSFV